MLGLNKNVVELVPYDESWVQEFEHEKKRLKKILGKSALDAHSSKVSPFSR